MSRAGVGWRSSDRCRTLELIISRNDLSVSDRIGAVRIELLCACDRSGSICFWLDVGSFGLCSSRIDLVLFMRLNGFGLFFLITFEVEAEYGDSAEVTSDVSDLAGPPTGFRITDLSAAESVYKVPISI